jgi:hypothetical protein
MLDTTHIETRGTRQSALMGRIGNAPAARATTARAGAVRVAAPEPAATVVEVFRGGQRSLQKF